MTEQPNSESPANFDNKTLTLAATALVACSNLIPSPTYKAIGAASAPCVAIATAYVFKKVKNMLYMYIEQRRAKQVYKEIIGGLQKKLALEQSASERAKIKKQIDKYEDDLHQLKIKNIKYFI